jgi:hypothetical protein
VESFPEKGLMGLYSFFTENGKGCLAMIGNNTLIYEVIPATSLRSLFIKFCQCSFSFINYNISSYKLPPHALQSVNPKHQCVLLSLSLPIKQWKFLCVTHTIGRTFSGGSQLRCYVDGDLVSSEKCRYVKSSLLCCMTCIL